MFFEPRQRRPRVENRMTYREVILLSIVFITYQDEMEAKGYYHPYGEIILLLILSSDERVLHLVD